MTSKSTVPVVVVSVAAVMPTALSAQGMYSVATGPLHLSPWAGIGLAGFLEAALIAAAVMAREAIAEEKPASDLLAATWVFSLVSGCLSAWHALTGPTGGLLVTMDTILAAALRIIAPLVACWLWHRLVTGQRTVSHAQERAERRRISAMRHLAQESRRTAPGAPEVPWTLRRAHARLLATDAHTDLDSWMRAVAEVDTLHGRAYIAPAAPATIAVAAPATEAPATAAAAAPVAAAAAAPAAVAEEAAPAMTATVAEIAPVAAPATAMAMDTVEIAVRPVPVPVPVQEPLALVRELIPATATMQRPRRIGIPATPEVDTSRRQFVRELLAAEDQADVTGRAVAAAMATAGLGEISERTGRRLLGEVREEIRTAV